jgi:hypothetical protein
MAVEFFDSRKGQEIFLLSKASRPGLGPTQPTIKWLPGVLFLGVKRQEREADPSPPSGVDVKNGRSLSPLPICLRVVALN